MLARLKVGHHLRVNNPRPFNEALDGEYLIREFGQDVDPEDLVWHRDHEDRYVTPINENDWLYQEDNKLPIPIKNEIFIPKGLYHRIIKGTTNLVVKIKKA